MEKFLKKYTYQFVAIISGGAIFLSFAHHFLDFWEQPASTMIGLFLASVSLLAWVIFLAARRVACRLKPISRRRFFSMSVSAILIGLFVAWRGYQAPSGYQTVTITPVLSQGQTIELLELKANKTVVPVKQAALKSNWQAINGVLYATETSKPIVISFKQTVNSPASVLFAQSPQGGLVNVSFENESVQTNLYSTEFGNVAVQFSAKYRGFPNWLFIPLLILVDTLAFGILVLAILILQDVGQNTVRQLADGDERFPSHRVSLVILLGLGLILHLFNALSTPLILDADSPAYLQGAVYWLKFGNLNGVSVFRGPGTTFLFAPILWIFGRNPWGMKTILHLIAIACIPVSYRLGWQLSKMRSIAFVGGLFPILVPDMFLYSNFVMSDLLNLFLVMTFCTLLILTLETPNFRNVLITLMVGSFASLWRSENVLLLAFAFVFLVFPHGYAWLQDVLNKNANNLKKHLQKLGTMGLAFTIAALPLIWWSFQYYKAYRFFSLGNHPGVVLYDGWVYYGDASNLSFSNPNSVSIQKINTATLQYPINITDKMGAPTSLEIYPSLIKAGYSSYEGFQLFENAAWDSIQKDWRLTLKLLFIKLRAGLRPEIANTVTYSLPGEPVWTNNIKLQFFDAENLKIPLLIKAQRAVNEKVSSWYSALYPFWILFCLLAMVLSLYRFPANVWGALVLILATRIFIPSIMGLSSWRYTLAGWIPLQIIAVNWIVLLFYGVKTAFKPNLNIAIPS